MQLDARSPVQMTFAAAFRAAIREGRLVQGQQLPGAARLAQVFRVAPKSVAKAYEQLRAEQLVVSQPSRGTVVADISALADTPTDPAVTVRGVIDMAELRPILTGLRGYRVMADALRAAILDGRLRPGWRLPGVDEVGAKFRLSARVVERAYRVLREEGLAIVLSGIGTVVTGPPDENDGGTPAPPNPTPFEGGPSAEAATPRDRTPADGAAEDESTAAHRERRLFGREIDGTAHYFAPEDVQATLVGRADGTPGTVVFDWTADFVDGAAEWAAAQNFTFDREVYQPQKHEPRPRAVDVQWRGKGRPRILRAQSYAGESIGLSIDIGTPGNKDVRKIYVGPRTFASVVVGNRYLPELGAPTDPTVMTACGTAHDGKSAAYTFFHYLRDSGALSGYGYSPSGNVTTSSTHRRSELHISVTHDAEGNPEPPLVEFGPGDDVAAYSTPDTGVEPEHCVPVALRKLADAGVPVAAIPHDRKLAYPETEECVGVPFTELQVDPENPYAAVTAALEAGGHAAVLTVYVEQVPVLGSDGTPLPGVRVPRREGHLIALNHGELPPEDPRQVERVLAVVWNGEHQPVVFDPAVIRPTSPDLMALRIGTPAALLVRPEEARESSETDRESSLLARELSPIDPESSPDTPARPADSTPRDVDSERVRWQPVTGISTGVVQWPDADVPNMAGALDLPSDRNSSMAHLFANPFEGIGQRGKAVADASIMHAVGKDGMEAGGWGTGEHRARASSGGTPAPKLSGRARASAQNEPAGSQLDGTATKSGALGRAARRLQPQNRALARLYGGAIVSTGIGVGVLDWLPTVITQLSSSQTAGMAVSLTSAAGMAAHFMGGPIADRFNKRRTLLTASTVGAVTSVGAAGWLSSGLPGAVEVIIGSTVVLKATDAIAGTITTTFGQKLVPKEQRGTAATLSLVERVASGAVGRFAVPVLGNVSLALPFGANAASYGVNFGAVWGLPDIPTNPEERARLFDGARAMWRDPYDRGKILLTPALALSGTVSAVLLADLIDTAGFSPTTSGLLLAAGSAGFLGGALVPKKVTEKINVRWMNPVASAMSAVNAAEFLVTNEPWILVPTMAVDGVAIMLSGKKTFEYELEIVPENATGGLVSTNATLFGAGGIAGGAVAAYGLSTVGPEALRAGAAGLFTAGAMTWGALGYFTRRKAGSEPVVAAAPQPVPSVGDGSASRPDLVVRRSAEGEMGPRRGGGPEPSEDDSDPPDENGGGTPVSRNPTPQGGPSGGAATPRGGGPMPGPQPPGFADGSGAAWDAPVRHSKGRRLRPENWGTFNAYTPDGDGSTHAHQPGRARASTGGAPAPRRSGRARARASSGETAAQPDGSVAKPRVLSRIAQRLLPENPALARLFGGAILSTGIGTGLSAWIPPAVTQLSDASTAGYAVALTTAAGLTAQLFAGPIADRFDNRRTILAASAIGVGTTAVAGGWLSSGLPGAVVVLVGSAGVLAAIDAVSMTTNMAFARRLATKEQQGIVTTLSLVEKQASGAVWKIAMPLLGNISLALPFWADAASYGVNYAAVRKLPAIPPKPDERPGPLDAVRAMWRDSYERGRVLLAPPLAIGSVAGGVLLADIAADHSPMTLGVLVASGSIGVLGELSG